MEWLFNPQALIALATLTALEIVLGIDNIVFISILASRLPEGERQRARVVGLALAMLSRIALLLSLTWVLKLTRPLFSVFGQEISGRDIILLAGGLFLLAKSTFEIHENLEAGAPKTKGHGGRKYFFVIAQIMLLDIIFSLDSVITAIGMARQVGIMVLAIVIAVIVMMVSVNGISRFIESHPTIKILALSFLILIGVSLIAEGLDFHIPKGYIYFAMAFSMFVEFLNHRVRQRHAEPVHLRRIMN
ncbi:MAG: TerC family protein [Candidatus Aminicenantales bacterium]